MEIIPLQGYSEEEKVHIANRYLIPRQIKENGITAEQIEFPEEAVRHIIRHYTREAGVRKLEQTIGTVCRKQARRVVEGHYGKAGRDAGDAQGISGRHPGARGDRSGGAGEAARAWLWAWPGRRPAATSCSSKPTR